jgi:hypothetical protein
MSQDPNYIPRGASKPLRDMSALEYVEWQRQMGRIGGLTKSRSKTAAHKKAVTAPRPGRTIFQRLVKTVAEAPDKYPSLDRIKTLSSPEYVINDRRARSILNAAIKRTP